MLDTSTVLRLDEVEEADLPVDTVISTVTLAELSVGPLVAEGDAERAARLALVQRADADFGVPLPFGVEEARAFARVAASIQKAGRKPKARAFDALIAATAKEKKSVQSWLAQGRRRPGLASPDRDRRRTRLLRRQAGGPAPTTPRRRRLRRPAPRARG